MFANLEDINGISLFSFVVFKYIFIHLLEAYNICELSIIASVIFFLTDL